MQAIKRAWSIHFIYVLFWRSALSIVKLATSPSILGLTRPTIGIDTILEISIFYEGGGRGLDFCKGGGETRKTQDGYDFVTFPKHSVISVSKIRRKFTKIYLKKI